MKAKYLSSTFQIVYGALLVVVIPAVVMANTLLLNGLFKQNMDVALQRQALVLGRTINASLQTYLDSPKQLQNIIVQVPDMASDIGIVEVISPSENQDFKVLASSSQDRKNSSVSLTQVYLTWHESQAIARSVSQTQLKTLISDVDLNSDSQSFWLVTLPLVDKNNDKHYILMLTVSRGIMVDLISQTITRSYLILTFTILILILLLAVHIRFFSYALKYQRIKEVDEMKDEFVSVASHELRSPLTVIKGYLSMLLEGAYGDLSVKAKSALKTANQSAERMSQLINDLLNVSRLQQGRLSFNFKEIRINDFVNSIVEDWKVQAEDKDLKLEADLPEEGYKIQVDPERLQQVLNNLISNAIKYTNRGGVKVKVGLQDDQVVITVRDTGIGIPPHAQEKLFSKFYRVKDPKAKTVSGTGLGLWISRELVLNMKGRIYLESIPGVGTEVTILFPSINN